MQRTETLSSLALEVMAQRAELSSAERMLVELAAFFGIQSETELTEFLERLPLGTQTVLGGHPETCLEGVDLVVVAAGYQHDAGPIGLVGQVGKTRQPRAMIVLQLFQSSVRQR